jgi:polysaccharide chain length determinant protein (PEP-CTERM system associated)
MVWQRRWLVVIPFLLISIGTAIVVYTLPNRYRAQTTIMIVPQRVPENYVPPTVTARLDERLQMISQQILSRPKLERIIQEFNLYERERKEMIMEDIIEQMRNTDIKVNIDQARSRRDDASTFRVSFESDSARTAMLVTERIASLFIKENLEDRSVLAEATSQFLEAQLEDARRRLMEHEQKLQDYRRSHQGSLPTQLQANLQAIQTTQQQAHGLQESMARDADRKTAIERMATDLRNDPVSAPTSSQAAADPGSLPGNTAAERLESARAALRSAELRLKAEHPDIQRFKRVIRDLEKDAEKEALQRPLSDGGQLTTPAASPADAARRTRLSELQGEYNAIQRRLTAGQAELARLTGLLRTYQARVEATPARESDLVALMRDYETLQTIYTGLLTKNEGSKVAANLERRQIGEQFRILDGARLPEKPVSPDRFRLNFMGALAGLGLGLGLVFLLEYRDTTFKTEGDIVIALALPVLALVPDIETKNESRVRVRRRLVVSAASVVFVVAVMAAAVWKLHLIERWVR